MRKRFFSGSVLLLLLPFILPGADKSKKAYELIYQDVQVIKQQILKLDEKIERNREEIVSLSSQLEELINLTRQSRNAQAGLIADQKKIPTQYQILLQKFDSLSTELSKISERLIEIQNASLPPPPVSGGEDPEGTSPEEEKPTGETEEPPQKEPSQTTIAPNLSPQEVYNMARSDYLKGNYQLAIEGFMIYRENFPESPLADNALYWIGECYFSQQKFEESILQFNELILSYPQGDKIAAAYLKKGISLAEQEKKEEALAVFKLLISKFPLEEETKIAQQKIKELEDT